jgi:hypothetical protein
LLPRSLTVIEIKLFLSRKHRIAGIFNGVSVVSILQNADCFHKMAESFLTICAALSEISLRVDCVAPSRTLQACIAFRAEVETRPERDVHRGQGLSCLVVQSHWELLQTAETLPIHPAEADDRADYKSSLFHSRRPRRRCSFPDNESSNCIAAS